MFVDDTANSRVAINEIGKNLRQMEKEKVTTLNCSLEIKNIIPDPLKHARPSRSSTQSHPFQVILPNPRTLSHKSSFIPKTCQLWNTLPSTTFPESYELSCFKSSINKLGLISLSNFPFSFFLCQGCLIGSIGLSLTLLTKKEKMLIKKCYENWKNKGKQ